MLRVVRLIVTVLPSLWPRPFVEVKLTSSPPLQDSPARDSGADPRLLPSVIPAASRLLPDLRQSAIIQTFVGRGHRVGTWRTLGKMRLALERGGEARRHAGIEYLLFWTMERYRGGCGSRGGGARKFPSFFSIVTPVKLWKSGSFRSFDSFRWTLVSKRFDSSCIQPDGTRMIDGGMMMRRGTIKQGMTGIILEIYLKFVLERQNWKIVFAIPLKIYKINFSENFFFLHINKVEVVDNIISNVLKTNWFWWDF